MKIIKGLGITMYIVGTILIGNGIVYVFIYYATGGK